MRADANRIALKAIRNILEVTKAPNIKVAGVDVACTVSRVSAPPWREGGLQGLDEHVDGPWPAPVDVDCRWDGGRCSLQVRCEYWGSGQYLHQTGLMVRLRDRAQMLIWITFPRFIRDLEDGSRPSIQASVSTFKRKSDADPEIGLRLKAVMQELLRASELPLVTASRVEICAIDVPSGAIVSGAEVAFERLVHLALLKLEFVDRGPQAKERGRAIVDLSRWGIELEKFGVEDESISDEMTDDEAIDEDDARFEGRRYWAGGFGAPERLQEFKNGGFWQIGWERSAVEHAAVNTWRRFASIQVGDYFAIKGYGGSHDLVVHFVGEVTTIEPDQGRVGLKRLDIPLYRGQAPRGRGAGGWFDTLVPVRRPDVIEQIFGVSQAQVPIERKSLGILDGIPANLILYGPPGTGKTYELQTKYLPRFVAQPTTAQTDLSSVVAGLKWYQVTALALNDLGGRARVGDLLAHRALKAKHAAQAIPTTLREIVWSTLGTHTVEGSKTVKFKQRSGELLFDKEQDGTWVLAEPLPEALQEVANEFERPNGVMGAVNHSFVTFHQAYAYEDFIEGIRPRIDSVNDEDGGTVTYDLVDGVFKRAVKAALQLAGFDGTIDDFCALNPEERRRQLEPAPRFAVFIDEINRGNVARILGELISLIETDKRLGAENELIVTLPYSGTRFGVPSNLHIIGTMNTADRSVEALDAALRRRFEFEEIPPRPELLDFTIEGDIDPSALLRTINRRLEVLRDRDHVIGHAYLLDLKDDPSLDALKHTFKSRIIPLLQEYFFGDWGKIGLVLGRSFVLRRELSTVQLAAFDHPERDALSDRTSWELVDVMGLTNLDFRSVYEPVQGV